MKQLVPVIRETVILRESFPIVSMIETRAGRRPIVVVRIAPTLPVDDARGVRLAGHQLLEIHRTKVQP